MNERRNLNCHHHHPIITTSRVPRGCYHWQAHPFLARPSHAQALRARQCGSGSGGSQGQASSWLPGSRAPEEEEGRRKRGVRSRERLVRLPPGGQLPPASVTSSFGGRSAGLGGAGDAPSGLRPGLPQWDSAPGCSCAQSRRRARPRRRRPGPGSGGASPGERRPSLPSWRPVGPWWPEPPRAASWPCCSWFPPRSGCRRRSRVSGASVAGGGLGLEGSSAGGSRGCSLHPAESCPVPPTAARV